MVRLSGSLLPSDVGGMAGVGTMGMLGSKGTVVEPYWGVHGKIARYLSAIMMDFKAMMRAAAACDGASTR